jgi:O-antigen/teichoic acid export membrane protein
MLQHALTWNTIATALRTALSLLRYLLIGRLLPPAAFGLFGLAKGLVDTVALLKRLGSNGSAITTELTSAQRGSLWTLDLFLGLLLYSLIWQGAPTLAVWYAAPALAGILRRLGLILVLSALTEHWYLRLQRDLRWRLLGLLHVASMGAGLLTLYFTRSLIAETLVQYAVSVAVVAIVGCRRDPLPLCFRGEPLRFSFHYGVNDLGRQAAGSVLSRLTGLLLLRAFGPAALGVYGLAVKLATQGPRRLNPILTRVLLPTFSRLSEREGRRLLRRSLRWLALANLALAGVIIFLAPGLLGWLFGPAWQAAIPLAQILAVAAGLEALADPVVAWLLSRAALRRVFLFDLSRSLLKLLAALAAARLFGTLPSLAWLRVLTAVMLAAWAGHQLRSISITDNTDRNAPASPGATSPDPLALPACRPSPAQSARRNAAACT